MASTIARRIEREPGIAGLAEALAGLPASDVRSLLMEVYRGRAARITPAGVHAFRPISVTRYYPTS